MAFLSDDESFTEYSDSSASKKYLYLIGGIVFLIVCAGVFALFFFAPWESDDDDSETALQKQYGDDVTAILDLAMKDTQGYIDLAQMVNTFGARLSGSTTLNEVSDWAKQKLIDDGFSNVHYEDAVIPAWKHNPDGDLLVMTEPYYKKLGVVPLGFSIPAQGLTGEVVVLTSRDDLATVDVTNKIVVWNVPFTSYSETVTYRSNGAKYASEANASASLTRSITPYSLYTPHTGNQNYGTSTPIPAAAITVEDAELLSYIQNVLKEKIVIELTLDVSDKDEVAPGQNIIAELTGTEIPEEIVVIGGHIDSWDVGTGAHDDAGGIWHCWEALRILKNNDFIPKRTIRLVMWTAEENGAAGSKAYYAEHIGEYENTTFALESDLGTLTPTGWSFQGNQSGIPIVQEIADLMQPTLTMTVSPGSAGVDVGPIISKGGVPGVGLTVTGDTPDKYFWYHHTNADTIDHIDETDFRQCVGAVASLIYVIADMDENLPRTAAQK